MNIFIYVELRHFYLAEGVCISSRCYTPVTINQLLKLSCMLADYVVIRLAYKCCSDTNSGVLFKFRRVFLMVLLRKEIFVCSLRNYLSILLFI